LIEDEEEFNINYISKIPNPSLSKAINENLMSKKTRVLKLNDFDSALLKKKRILFDYAKENSENEDLENPYLFFHNVNSDSIQQKKTNNSNSKNYFDNEENQSNIENEKEEKDEEDVYFNFNYIRKMEDYEEFLFMDKFMLKDFQKDVLNWITEIKKNKIMGNVKRCCYFAAYGRRKDFDYFMRNSAQL